MIFSFRLSGLVPSWKGKDNDVFERGGGVRYISLFAGIGGFDLALNRLGHTCVWANEWDKYAAQIYEKNFSYQGGGEQPRKEREYEQGYVYTKSGGEKAHIDTRDIRTVPTSEIPDHDLLVGGFPCQAFSIAGKRRGFDDTRGTLFFEIARILKDKQPKLFILENVKGLLSHDGGNTFKIIISTLDELGYDLQWQVVNSKNFGVPQNRERVFIVGHLRGTSRPKVFPFGGEGKRSIKQLELVGNCNPSGRGQSGGVYSVDGLHPTIGAGGGNPNRKRDIGWSSGYIRQHTLKSSNVSIRRLTPTECERLQGFPDGWTEGISDTQRYKCLGNAVTVNVVYEIAKRL